MTFVGIAADLRVVRPFRLLWRTTFVSKNISNTNYEAQRCVENFLGALLHHQVVFKISHFELFLRKSSKFGYQFQKITISARLRP